MTGRQKAKFLQIKTDALGIEGTWKYRPISIAEDLNAYFQS